MRCLRWEPIRLALSLGPFSCQLECSHLPPLWSLFLLRAICVKRTQFGSLTGLWARGRSNTGFGLIQRTFLWNHVCFGSCWQCCIWLDNRSMKAFIPMFKFRMNTEPNHFSFPFSGQMCVIELVKISENYRSYFSRSIVIFFEVSW